jgi:Protein of unknown function (DUF1571)
MKFGQEEENMLQPCTFQGSRFAAPFVFVLASFVLVPAAHTQSERKDQSSMDQAIDLITQARQRFQNVKDYECKAISLERVNGKLLPEGTATMKVRNNPFSIYLRCESPDAERGIQVCYVANQNQGKMRVHPNGFFGIFGFVSLSPRDPRALEKNRHDITEAGLGNLLESTARYWAMERRLDKTQVEIANDVINGRACTRIVTVHPDRNAGSFYGYRCVLWLDKETLLPVGAETYDWPRPKGAAGGDLLERYRFLDVRCNIGLNDKLFAH